MIYKKLVVGPLQCNCAILACEKTKEAVIIDPGDEGARIASEVQASGFTVKALLHTHAHFDHIGGTKEVKEALSAPIWLHKADLEIYNNLPLQGRMFGFSFVAAPAVDNFLEDGQTLNFGEHSLEVIHTPGHSPGGVCFRKKDGEEMIFSGDTLFQMSVGRSDLWGGDHEQMIHSIKDRLLVLSEDTPVHPGHGPSTMIGIEKRSNPFL